MTRVFITLFIIIYGNLDTASASSIDDFSVDIKYIAKSGKTVGIKTGELDGISNNDYGVLVQKKSFEDGQIIYKPVAKLRAVKVFKKESIWVIYRIFLPEEIKNGRGLFLFSESKMLQGRKKIDLKRNKIFTQTENIKEIEDFYLEGDTLRKKVEEYSKLQKLHSKEKFYDQDVELLDVEKFKANDDELSTRTTKVLYHSPYSKSFRQSKRVETFEKMLVAFLNKYNNPSFDYDDFYKEQTRSRTVGDFTDKRVSSNYAKLFEENLLKKANKEREFYQNVIAKGDRWSEDYSDDELTELLKNMSIVRERKRRRDLYNSNYNSQAYASVGFNLINNENSQDTETRQTTKADFEISYESYLFKKVKSLESLSLEVSGRRATDGFYGGELNLKSTEISAAVHVNWYPFLVPTILERNIVYVGSHLRYGRSRVQNDSFGEEGNYQIYSFPGLRLGVKYNFEQGFGARLFFNYENITVSRIIKSADEGNLPDRSSYLEGKLAFGISKLF